MLLFISSIVLLGIFLESSSRTIEAENEELRNNEDIKGKVISLRCGAQSSWDADLNKCVSIAKAKDSSKPKKFLKEEESKEDKGKKELEDYPAETLKWDIISLHCGMGYKYDHSVQKCTFILNDTNE